MKILLIMPDANIHKLNIGRWGISFREAPLTLTLLAALIPEKLNTEVRLADESVRPLPKGRDYDLVGISCITGTALRAYELAAKYRRLGIPVVL